MCRSPKGPSQRRTLSALKCKFDIENKFMSVAFGGFTNVCNLKKSLSKEMHRYVDHPIHKCMSLVSLV